MDFLCRTAEGLLIRCHYTAKSITKNIEPILKTIKDFVFKEYFLARTASPRKYWMMTKYNGRMSKHAMSATELFSYFYLLRDFSIFHQIKLSLTLFELHFSFNFLGGFHIQIKNNWDVETRNMLEQVKKIPT